MSACDFQSRLDAFYDDELDQVPAKAVRDHLAACETCDSELRAMRSMTSLLCPDPPADFLDGAMGRLRASALRRVHSAPDTDRSTDGDRMVLPLVRILTAIAASFLVIGAAWLVELRGIAPAPRPTGIEVTSGQEWEKLAAGGALDVPLGAPSIDLPSDVAANDFVRDSLNEGPQL